MKIPTFLIVFGLTIFTALTSCRKAVEQGKVVKASGTVFDPVKNKPLANAKLYLFGAHTTFYGIYYTDGPLDSTVSDNSGKFSIQHTADGKSIDYGLTVGQLEYGGYNYGNQINYVVDPYERMYKFNYSIDVKNAIVTARELNYTKLHLKVMQNPYDTFIVKTSVASGQLTYVKGQSFDTVVYLRHLPSFQNIIYYRTERNTVDSFFIRREIRDTVNAGMADTLFINKTINNTYSMPRG